MDRLIYTAMTGAKHILEQQANTSNNLANATTTGFRAQIDAFRAVPVVPIIHWHPDATSRATGSYRADNPPASVRAVPVLLHLCLNRRRRSVALSARVMLGMLITNVFPGDPVTIAGVFTPSFAPSVSPTYNTESYSIMQYSQYLSAMGVSPHTAAAAVSSASSRWQLSSGWYGAGITVLAGVVGGGYMVLG